MQLQGQLAKNFADIDYFPSYELIAGHTTRAAYYEKGTFERCRLKALLPLWALLCRSMLPKARSELPKARSRPPKRYSGPPNALGRLPDAPGRLPTATAHNLLKEPKEKAGRRLRGDAFGGVLAMTICVVGNSHVIALKEAADDFPWAFSYFCAPGFNLADVIVEDGKLVAGTERLKTALSTWDAVQSSNVQKEVELKASSAFIVVGLGLSLMHLARSYASVRLFNHVSRKTTIVSVDCLEEILGCANSIDLGLQNRQAS